MKLLFAILLLTFSLGSAAEVAEASKPNILEEAVDAVGKKADAVAKSLDRTKSRRESTSYFTLLNYSPYDLIIPSKIGLTLGLNGSGNKTWELEYLSGSVAVPFFVKDLGKMADTRISLIGRNYFGGNSFNMSYGLSYFDFDLHLGDSLLNGLTGGAYPSLDVIEMQSLGLNLAIGNRWAFKHNIVFGVDWISWAQPIYTLSRKSDFLNYTTNSTDRDNVETALKVIKYLPRIAVLKLQLGIQF